MRKIYERGARDTAKNGGTALTHSEPDGGMDEQQKALHAALGTPRRQRAVGVRYCKDTEARSHYVKAPLAAQCDAWVHVDRTTALAPLRS